MTPAALLIDFGGVLTTDPFASFGSFCVAMGLPPDSVPRTLRKDPQAHDLLIAFETGRIGEAEFERGFALRLAVCAGVDVPHEKLVDRLMEGLSPEPTMLAAVARVRASGAVTVLVSNSIGLRAYEGYGLDDIFDHQVVSENAGVRKPSRAIYELAAELAGVPPSRCVFVDDLEHNVTAARRLGMSAIQHRRPAETVEALDAMFEPA